MKRLFKQFSFPGGIPSHVAPETPGSIHEGGELGYALQPRLRRRLRQPRPDRRLRRRRRRGRDRARWPPAGTATSSSTPPRRRRAADPAPQRLQDRQPHRAGPHRPRGAGALLRGYGYTPYFVEGDEPETDAPADGRDARRGRRRDRAIQAERPCSNGCHGAAALADDRAPHAQGLDRPEGGGRQAGRGLLALAPGAAGRHGTTRAPQDARRVDEELPARGAVRRRRAAACRSWRSWRPKGERRMGANPHANGGLLLRDLRLPDFRDYAVDVPEPGATTAEATRVLGKFLRDVMKLNLDQQELPHLRPGRDGLQPLAAVFEVDRQALGGRDPARPTTTSRPTAASWRCSASTSARAGWRATCSPAGTASSPATRRSSTSSTRCSTSTPSGSRSRRHIPWRRPIASLNYLLASHVWRQDHNGFTHQDPGFIDHVVNKKAEVIRVYLPPDANTLLSVIDHCLRSRNYVNVIVAGKQPAPQWLDMDQAVKHCTAGIGIWEWASNDQGGEPDVVMACAGDVPTLETLAAVELLREHVPELKIRVVNVVDLMKLQPASEHPHGLDRPGLRRAVHQGQADHLRLPRLSVADPPPDLPPDQPPQPARARLQGGGDDHDAVRHGGAERPRPLPPGRAT